MAYRKGDQAVQDLVKGFGGANFADILNRLWMGGVRAEDLQKALATTPNGTNDPSDIITRLLNANVVNADQLKAAPTSQVPNDPNFKWPFHPEDQFKVNGVVVAQPVGLAADQLKAISTGTATSNTGVAPAPIGGTAAPKPIVTPKLPAPAPTVTNITNITQKAADTKAEEKAPVTDQQVADYEAKHYGTMLWVRTNPDLAKLMKDASTGQWSAEKFTAELHNTDWWKTTAPTIRDFTQLQNEDPANFQRKVGTNTNIAKTYASTMGITLDDATAQQLGSDLLKFGWTDQELHQAILGHATSSDQIGTLGATETQIRGLGKSFLSNVSDDEAFNWSKQIAGGTMSLDNVNQALRLRARASYPSIADYIDQGGTPKDYFNQHIQDTARLLEVDPSTIDLTDPRYNQIISYADPQNGKVRPMTLSETDKFIRSKDEYWKTNNANDQVSKMLNNIGSVFGKVGMNG